MMRSMNTALSLLLLSGTALAQINVGGTPFALQHGLDNKDLPEMHAQALDLKLIQQEDQQRELNSDMPAYGRLLDISADLRAQGQWTLLPNGDQVARLKITSTGALATELFFNDLFIPEGAVMFIYDATGEEVLGGFTSGNNSASGAFTTAQIKGATSIVEYYEPLARSGEGRIQISHVGHAYRMVPGVSPKADDCEVDVNCSPEGADWADERDGVVRISVVAGGFLGWCTGSVVNNTAQDCKPYVLSAWHCGDGSTTTNFNNYKFYFRYQRNGCGSGVALTNKVMTGCVKRADSSINSNNDGSDFMLLELDDMIPDDYTPYFAGWNATGNISTSGVSIHHPAGDEKKISTYTNMPNSTTWPGSPFAFHWLVYWSGTVNGHGVTEGGSSGSPIYDNNGSIVGTLTGGSSFCNSVQPGGQNQPDAYGKMSKHWTENGTANNKQLKPWLDPTNSGVTTLPGTHDPCGMYSVFSSVPEQVEQAVLGTYPNPATDVVSIRASAPIVALQLIDLAGRVVQNIMAVSGQNLTIPVSDVPNGTYFIRALTRDGQVLSSKITIFH